MWWFANCRYDEKSGVLLVAGKSSELDEPCQAILTILLQNAGQRVSKEQLLQAGWPSRIVHENSLAKAIGRLRSLLGDQDGTLKTVYGYGYKLDAEATFAADEVSSRLSSDSRPVDEARRLTAFQQPRGARGRTILIGAFILSLGAIGATLVAQSRPDPATQFRASPPVTADPVDAIGRLLWVDDNPQNNIYEERLFESRRIAVHIARTTADALQLLSMNDYDIVISDMGRGEDRLAGLRLVELMRSRGDSTPVVIYTVRPDTPEQRLAQKTMVADAGAQGLVLTPEDVRSAVLRSFGNPPPR